MQSLGLIIKINNSCLNKCEIYAEAKLTKKTCASTQRESKLLSLIHIDIGDLKQTHD